MLHDAIEQSKRLRGRVRQVPESRLAIPHAAVRENKSAQIVLRIAESNCDDLKLRWLLSFRSRFDEASGNDEFDGGVSVAARRVMPVANADESLSVLFGELDGSGLRRPDALGYTGRLQVRFRCASGWAVHVPLNVDGRASASTSGVVLAACRLPLADGCEAGIYWI